MLRGLALPNDAGAVLAGHPIGSVDAVLARITLVPLNLDGRAPASCRSRCSHLLRHPYRGGGGCRVPSPGGAVARGGSGLRGAVVVSDEHGQAVRALGTVRAVASVHYHQLPRITIIDIHPAVVRVAVHPVLHRVGGRRGEVALPHDGETVLAVLPLDFDGRAPRTFRGRCSHLLRHPYGRIGRVRMPSPGGAVACGSGGLRGAVVVGDEDGQTVRALGTVRTIAAVHHHQFPGISVVDVDTSVIRVAIGPVQLRVSGSGGQVALPHDGQSVLAVLAVLPVNAVHGHLVPRTVLVDIALLVRCIAVCPTILRIVGMLCGLALPYDAGAVLACHSVRTVLAVGAVAGQQDILSGIYFSGQNISVGHAAVLRLEQAVALLVIDGPKGRIACPVRIDALPRCVAHPDDAQIRHEHSVLPVAQVADAGAVLPVHTVHGHHVPGTVPVDIALPVGRVLVCPTVLRVGGMLCGLALPYDAGAVLAGHSVGSVDAVLAILAVVSLPDLEQPVRTAFRRLCICPALVHTQPDAAIVAHPVVIVVMSGGPGSAVVGGADGRAVGLHLEDLSGEIDRVQVGGIAFQRHPVDVQVAEVAVLLRDVLRADFPRVLLPELAGVGAGLVDGGLAGGVGEVAVAGEVHLRLGMDGVAGAQRIGERAEVAAGHARDAEIGGGEAGEGEVSLPVVRVLRGVQRRVLEMVDAQRDVAQGHRAQLAVLQLQDAGAGGERVPFCIGVRRAGQHDAGTRHAPLDAEEHFHAVASDFRHLQPLPEPQAAHLAIAFLVDLGTEASQAAGKPVLADDDAVQEGHQEGHRFRMCLGEEFQSGTEGGIHVMVAGRLRVRGLDDVDDGLFRLPGQFVVQAAQLVLQRLLPARANLVRAGHGGLAEVVQLAHHLGDTGVLVAAGEVFLAQQPHVPAHLQRGAVVLDIVAVGGAVVFLRVEAVGGEEVVHGFGVGLLGGGDVLLRKGEVPGDVGVAHLRDDFPAGQLGAVVRIDVDDFPLLRVLVPVGLEGTLAVAAPGQLAGLEGEHLHVVGNLVVRGVEVHPAVLEVVDRVVAAFLVGQLFAADGGDGTDVLRVDVCEGGFLVAVLDAVEVRVPVHVGCSGR